MASDNPPLNSNGPVIHQEDGSVEPMPVAPVPPTGKSPEKTDSETKSSKSSSAVNSSQKLKTSSLGQKSKSNAADSSDKSIDRKLVAETQQQIKSLVNEIVELAKEDISRKEFYSGFLTRCVTALSSNGGAVWLKQDNLLTLDHQVNLAKVGLPPSGDQAVMHDRLLKRLAEKGEGTIEPPNSTQSGGESGNPTESLLVIAPIKSDGQTLGLVEIFQRTGGGPVTQRGYLRFLMQMAELAGEFEKQHRIRQLDQRQELWTRLEQFLTCIHKTLDPIETSYRIASDGRRFIDCDRMTVASIQGRQPKVVASSGLDMVQRRADQIKAMEKLISVVCRAKKPLHYSGDSSNLAPQIEDALHEYLDLSHSKSVAVIPVAYRQTDIDWDEINHQHQAKTGKKKKPQKKKLLGAFVVENLASDEFTEVQLQRIDLVKHHGTLALGNADQHNDIFLMPLWKMVGSWAKAFHFVHLPKTLSVIALLLAVIIGLIIVPFEFAMPADGIIQPVNRHEVYASTGGIVQSIPLDEKQNVFVSPNQVLVDLVNEDLEGEYSVLDGQRKRQVKRWEVAQLLLAHSNDKESKEGDAIQHKAQIQEAVGNHDTIIDKMRLIVKKKDQLAIRSPIGGQVVDWNQRQKLLNRPINVGERLMTVVDPKGDWEVEAYLPERGSVHVLKEFREAGEVPVEFVLSSHPGETFSGKLTKMEHSTFLHPEFGSVIRCNVAFDKEELDPFLRRPGTKVRVKFLCGNRSVGYVMFREVWETMQSQVLFWF